MKKILLLSLALLSTKVFAADIDLQCKRRGYDVVFEFIELRDSDIPYGYAEFYSVLFDNAGNVDWFLETGRRDTEWLDTEIIIWDSLGRSVIATIDRGTLEYAFGSNPFDRLKYDCEVIDNLEAKVKRWREEKEAKEKAEKEAKKAKNVI